MATALTLRQLNRTTLARQMLLARHKIALPQAIARLVGLQAQVARPAFVGLWSRVQGATRDKIAALFHDRTIVRATMMRGTLHVVTKADYLQLRAAQQPDFDRTITAILGERLGGIEPARLLDVARKYFAAPHTFDEAREHLLERFPGLDERAMGYTVRLTLPLVQMPTDDPWAFPAQASFVSAQAWLRAVPEDARAPDVIVRRYLEAYGPATVTDAQAWLGMQKLKPVFERLRPTLVSLRGPGRAELFDVPSAPAIDADAPAPVRFLPEWDNLLIGRGDERFLATAHRTAVFLPGLRVLPTFLVDGLVAGSWKIERKKTEATLALTPFGKIAKSVRAELEEEGEQLLAFVEPGAETRGVKIES